MTKHRVLLINPPWITKDQNVWHGIKAAMPPLSLLSIAAVLEGDRFDVQVLDIHVEKLTEKEVERRVRDFSPQIIGITMMTSTAITGHRVAQISRDAAPTATIVVGGVHPDAVPVETLRNRAIDYVVHGDGEYTFHDICQQKSAETIQGISYRSSGEVIRNPDRPLERDLGALPPYAYHLINFDKYYPALGAYKRLPAINMLMTRGCPGKCIFCNSAETLLRCRPAEQVVDEIINLRDTYGIREIQFYDDTFTVLKKNVFEFCRLMKERKVGVTFCCFARADCFSEQMAIALKEAGCHQVMFGVESASRDMLRVLRKDIDLDRTKSAIAIAKSVGINVRVALLFGTPGETTSTVQETIDTAVVLDPDIAIFNIITPYPGTQLYAWAEKNGLLKTKDWWDYELGTSIIDIPSITPDELKSGYYRAFKTYYNRPKIYLRRLRAILSFTHLRDTIEAFFQIFFKAAIWRANRHNTEWTRHNKQDFYDLDLGTEVSKVKIPDVLSDIPTFHHTSSSSTEVRVSA